jgi:hypothetical protein
VYFIGSAQHSEAVSNRCCSILAAGQGKNCVFFFLHAESELKAPSINWDKRYFGNELAYSQIVSPNLGKQNQDKAQELSAIAPGPGKRFTVKDCTLYSPADSTSKK